MVILFIEVFIDGYIVRENMRNEFIIMDFFDLLKWNFFWEDILRFFCVVGS